MFMVKWDGKYTSPMDPMGDIFKKNGSSKHEDNNRKLGKSTDHFNFTTGIPYVKDDYGLDLLTKKGVHPYDVMTDFPDLMKVSRKDCTQMLIRPGVCFHCSCSLEVFHFNDGYFGYL